MAATDLEALWAGPFGDAYTERNRAAGADRGPFWQGMREKTAARTWLEVGCNAGANLRWLPSGGAFGLDVNREALALAADVTCGGVVTAFATALPFAPRAVDLVFTCGTLIHVRRDRVAVVMDELVRVARRWVLLMEYAAPGDEVVDWRGQPAALWRAPYGRRFEARGGPFALRDYGHLRRGSGFDDVTWWLFERRKD